jgi:predicted DNA-binding transcriptional regulator AlpA
MSLPHYHRTHDMPKPTIPEALENFDNLPDSAYVTQPVVEGLFACSAPTVWRRIKTGLIPKPKRFSTRCSRWNVGELRAALEASVSE